MKLRHAILAATIWQSRGFGYLRPVRHSYGSLLKTHGSSSATVPAKPAKTVKRSASERPGAALTRLSDSLGDLAELVLAGKSPEQQKLIIADFIADLRAKGHPVPDITSTPYLNTVHVDEEPEYPGDLEMERLIRAHIRWNAMAMVVKANKHTNVGGHIATFS